MRRNAERRLKQDKLKKHSLKKHSIPECFFLFLYVFYHITGGEVQARLW